MEIILAMIPAGCDRERLAVVWLHGDRSQDDSSWEGEDTIPLANFCRGGGCQGSQYGDQTENRRREGSWIELRQQSWGEGIGWFTQSTIVLEPQQWAQLKTTMGVSVSRTAPVKRRAAAPCTPAENAPKLMWADSA